MADVVGILNLEPAELPDFTTVCARYQELKMAVWRALHCHSAELVKPGSVHAIDATG
ncbi:transposase IS4 family protein [Halorhabdus tiamatea SARL4B]|uniref:Transposase IS4 family protein n=1 Tax=Halorhabdus tiamatea SARL4B TaxID=1033806 RepID=U2FCW8_9EURY|nr:transposase IS4 family protein [Halorhabdus tiamatea SARL4B]